MMAGTGDDREDFKGLKDDDGLSLDQDLQQQVSGGSKGNDNVCGDVGGSYVFVSEGNGCDLVGDVDVENEGVVIGIGGNDSGLLAETGKCELLVESEGVGVVESGEADCEVVVGVEGNDCEVKVEDHVFEKDESGAGVENVEVVVGIGGSDQDYKVEEDNCELSVMTEKDVVLHGEFLVESGSVGVVEGGEADCEVKVEDQVGLKDGSGVGVEKGEVVSGIGANDCEVKVESQVCNKDESGAGLKNGEVVVEVGGDDCEVKVEDQVGLNEKTVVKVKNGEVDVRDGRNDRDYATEEDNCVAHELGQDHELKQINDLANDAELGESKETGIKSEKDYSSGDFVNGETLVVVAKANPFQFLIKVPRFDDDKLRERIKDAQTLVEEKTTRRYDIRIEIEMKRAKLQLIFNKFEATKSDERAARRLVKLKRQEINFIQDRINKMKNSISVMDINSRIMHMEHMIEHETNPLEEKHLLSEISILRKLRDQISSNVYSDNEDNSPFGQMVLMEMQLQTLKKELGDLKAKVSNSEGVAILLRQEYSGECKKLREFQAQFKAANDVRQEAYQYYLGLERQLHEKSKHYFIYKDEAQAANNYALNGDREALYRLCTNQVETFMDLWNKDDEFRGEYVRCNKESTLRRFKTLDGHSLGPNEEARTTNPSPPTKKPVKREQVDGESWLVAEPRKMSKDQTSVVPIPESQSILHNVSGRLQSFETLEEKKQEIEEENESERIAEMVREEEVATKMKEKLRQEERAKAQEALERKRRNAEKAQMRAMLRAQKEAEQKEKEKEKRLRKKEKKNADGEGGLELPTNPTMKLEDSTDILGTKLKKSPQSNKYCKTKAATIPPPQRNKGRRQIFKEIMCWILVFVGVVLMIMVMNDSSYRTVKPRTKGDSFSGNHWQPI